MSDELVYNLDSRELKKPDFENKLEPIIIYPLDPMALKQEMEYNSIELFRSFFSILNDPVRLELLKLLAFKNKSFKELKDNLKLTHINLLGHIKILIRKQYIYHVKNGEFALTDGGRVITRLINKVAKYLDPKIYMEENSEIIFPFDYHFR